MLERCIKLNNLIWTFNDRKQEKWVRFVTNDVFESLLVLNYRCNGLIGSDGIIDAFSTIFLTTIFILTLGATWNCRSLISFDYNIIIVDREIKLRVCLCLFGNIDISDHWNSHYLKSNTDFLTTFFWPIHISNEHVACFLSETELFKLLLNDVMIVGIVLFKAFYITLVVKIQIQRFQSLTVVNGLRTLHFVLSGIDFLQPKSFKSSNFSSRGAP